MKVYNISAGDMIEEDSQGTREVLSQFTRGTAINMERYGETDWIGYLSFFVLGNR